MLRQGLRDLLERVERAENNGNGRGGRPRNVQDDARGGERGSPSRGTSAGGNRFNSRRGAPGADRASQLGDWTCAGCGFQPNFARRRDCFRCRRRRSPRAEGRAALPGGAVQNSLRGPIGANGSRPLLGGRGPTGGGAGTATKPAEVAPTHRVPGSSVAARAVGNAGQGTWADAAKRAGTGIMAHPPVAGAAKDKGRAADTTGSSAGPTLDEEGYQVVTRRGGGRAPTNVSASGPAKPTGGPSGEGSKESDEMDDDVPGAAEDEQGEPEGEEGPTVAELHRAWQSEVTFVKKLRQQGVQEGHPAMRAACEARDNAEQAWRDAKEPAPAAIRLGRAQNKLDRALALQADARQAVLDEERAHRERMQELQAALDECTTRVGNRRRQLSEIQGEVGASGGGGGARSKQQEAIRRVHDTICSDVGPTIAALVEQLDTATPAWATLNGLLGKLSTSKEVLEEACPPQACAQEFDIADDAERRWEEASDWSEGRDLQEAGGSGAGKGGGDCDACDQQGDGRDATHHGWGPGGLHGATQDCYMDTDDWWGQQQRGWKTGTHWYAQGHGQWQRASWADQMEQELQEAEEADGQPAATRRRVGPADTQRAQESGGGGPQQQHSQSQQQFQQQQGTISGALGGGTAARDPEEGRRLHEERVSSVVNAAINAGVNPVSASGEDLRLLSPSQLDAWAAENIPASGQR